MIIFPYNLKNSCSLIIIYENIIIIVGHVRKELYPCSRINAKRGHPFPISKYTITVIGQGRTSKGNYKPGVSLYEK